jgi:hypothetical protein
MDNEVQKSEKVTITHPQPLLMGIAKTHPLPLSYPRDFSSFTIKIFQREGRMFFHY